jgi:hypothetical protein
VPCCAGGLGAEDEAALTEAIAEREAHNRAVVLEIVRQSVGVCTCGAWSCYVLVPLFLASVLPLHCALSHTTPFTATSAATSAAAFLQVGDLPSADVTPPENILFVCKLNKVGHARSLPCCRLLQTSYPPFTLSPVTAITPLLLLLLLLPCR